LPLRKTYFVHQRSRTYIHLAQEETNAEQKNDLLKDLDRELTSADSYISELETKTLLSGENDHSTPS